MEGTIGPTEKNANASAPWCCVDDCGKPSFWDIHLDLKNPIIKGLTVAMCREHGDTAHPGPATE